MSVQTKKRFKVFSKTIGLSLFVLLMLTNIRIALIDDSEISSGSISFFGLELQLFDQTAAQTTTGSAKCTAKKTCASGGEVSCEGYRSCETTYNGVRCDDVTATCQ